MQGNFYQLSGQSSVIGTISGIVHVALLTAIVCMLQIYIAPHVPYFVVFIAVYIVFVLSACVVYETKEKKQV